MSELEKRMSEFVDYHNHGDGECNGVLLKAWADLESLGVSDRFNLSFFYATVYNIPSAIFMLKQVDEIKADPLRWCTENKRKLMFQSDRRYMRCRSSLEKTLEAFSLQIADGKGYIDRNILNDKIDTSKALSEAHTWPNFGRFGSYLFVETLTHVLGLESANRPEFDLANGATATSGIMNVFGNDSEADLFDKTKKLAIPEELLQRQLGEICARIEESGGNPDLSCVETSLCAYRKFFKGSRYNGYYLDRQLEELYTYPRINADSLEYINELFELRELHFDKSRLGEFRGWDGVRPKMKRHYLRTGDVG